MPTRARYKVPTPRPGQDREGIPKGTYPLPTCLPPWLGLDGGRGTPRYLPPWPGQDRGRGYPKVPTPHGRSGQGRGYPKVSIPPPPQPKYLPPCLSGWGEGGTPTYLPPSPGQGTYPPPPPPPPRTCYTAGGMPLAFTQEDSCVLNRQIIGYDVVCQQVHASFLNITKTSVTFELLRFIFTGFRLHRVRWHEICINNKTFMLEKNKFVTNSFFGIFLLVVIGASILPYSKALKIINNVNTTLRKKPCARTKNISHLISVFVPNMYLHCLHTYIFFVLNLFTYTLITL